MPLMGSHTFFASSFDQQANGQNCALNIGGTHDNQIEEQPGLQIIPSNPQWQNDCMLLLDDLPTCASKVQGEAPCQKKQQ